jgi:CheY-like chemotaxis protein
MAHDAEADGGGALGDAAVASGGRRVLVVEDNPHVHEMYRYALRKHDPSIALEHAPDGRDALLRLAEAPRVDLVLCDLFMPVLDGFALVARMREDPALARIPVIVISAGGAEARERALELGVDVYLQKPVQLTDVVNTLRTLLGMRR